MIDKPRCAAQVQGCRGAPLAVPCAPIEPAAAPIEPGTDGSTGFVSLRLPSGAEAAGPVLLLPRARRQRASGHCVADAAGMGVGEGAGAESEESEEEEETEGEGESEEECSQCSPPSTPPTAAAACLEAAARARLPGSVRGQQQPHQPQPQQPLAPALVAGDVLSSAASGRAYMVLHTIAGANVGHGKKHTSILLAAPLCGGLQGPQQGEANAGCGQLRVVIKVVERATYVQRYGPAAFSCASGAAIGELTAHARLRPAAAVGGACDMHVLPLLEAMADETHLYMIFPHADGPDAFDAVAATQGGLPEEEARNYFADMALGVLHLKRHGVSHGDLSLENACLHREPDGSYSCHLIDLELARLVVQGGAVSATTIAAAQAGRSHAGGKPGYVSPEGAYGTVLDWHAADQWSLGICLYIMLTARPLYSHPDDRAFEILANGGAPFLLRHYAAAYGLALPEGAAELVTALLRPDPRDRPTVEEVLMHPWVRPALEARGVEGQGRPRLQRPGGMEAGMVKQ